MKSREGLSLESEPQGPKFQYDIMFLRHAERVGMEDALTEKGKEMSRDYGKSVVFEKIAGRTSKTIRTKQTVEEIYSTAPADTKFTIRTKKSLHFKDYFSPEYLEKIRAMIKSGQREEAGLYQLEFEDVRPDPNTFSAKEMAAGVAGLLKHYLGMAEHFKPDTKLGLLNISHDFVLTPFVAETLRRVRAERGERVSMKEALVSSGGTLKPLEEIRFSLTGDGRERSLKMFFRDQSFDLDQRLINEMANYGHEE
jgi:hypothetical protein